MGIELNRRLALIAAFALVGVGTTALVMGLHKKAPVATKHIRHHHSVGGGPVAPWDFVDQPNSHKISSPGAPMAMPTRVVVAKDGVATLPNGLQVRLLGIDKVNSVQWEHWWGLDGGPLPKNPDASFSGNSGEIPAHKDGRFRSLHLVLSTAQPLTGSILGYVPDGALNGLKPEEKLMHGWEQVEDIRVDKYPMSRQSQLFVDDPKASRFLFGMSSGEWKPIDSEKNGLGKAPYLGQVAISGPWGSATVTQEPNPKINDFASTKDIGSIDAASAKPRWSRGIMISIEPLSGPMNDEFNMRAFDKAGAEIPINTHQNKAWITLGDIPKIARFQIQARPYTYALFDDLAYDPDPNLWKNYVWGNQPVTEKTRIDGLEAELRAIETTTYEAHGPSQGQYVVDHVETADGHIWRDVPSFYEASSHPSVASAPDGSPQGDQSAKKTPPPIHALITFRNSGTGEDAASARIEILGSDSEKPGEGLHPEWNKRPLNWKEYDQPRRLPENLWAAFAMTPETKYAQIRIEAAVGAWTKTVEVAPDPEDIKPSGAEYRTLTLEVGSTVHLTYRAPGNVWVNKVLSKTNLDGMDKRVFIRLKSGKRMQLKASSYHQYGNAPLSPGFDFDRDATTTEGDMIALADVAAFEIETRPLKVGYLVYRIHR